MIYMVSKGNLCEITYIVEIMHRGIELLGGAG